MKNFEIHAKNVENMKLKIEKFLVALVEL